MVELDRNNDPESFRKKRLPASAGAHGVIREVFARRGARVQMTLPFRKPTNNDQLNSAPKGKAQNVAQEVVTRQLGALFGRPAELYHAVGMNDFGLCVADDLDVIAFSLRISRDGVRYLPRDTLAGERRGGRVVSRHGSRLDALRRRLR